MSSYTAYTFLATVTLLLCGTDSHHPTGSWTGRLEGSEGTALGEEAAGGGLPGHQELAQEKFVKFYPHRPLVTHYLAPFFQQAWSHKLAALSYIKGLKPTLTSTRTVLLQTTRRERKHLLCYKAPHHDLPACLPDTKEGSFILPTAVPQAHQDSNTQLLGFLEGSELKPSDHYDQVDDLIREQRHLHKLFKHTKYVTKTLWVTKVEDYIDTHVTATLLASNCIPCHANIPPCPEKVEHYVHYEVAHEETRPVHENESHDYHHHKQGKTRENDKEYLLEERIGSELDLLAKNMSLPEHYVSKKE